MIRVFLRTVSFSISLKDNLFINSFFFADKNILFLFFTFPLVFFLISTLLFKNSSYFLKKFYFFSFSSVFFFLSLCFFRNLTIFFLIFLERCVVFMVMLILILSKDSDKISSVFFIFLLNILGSIPFIIFSFYFCNSFLFSEVFLVGGVRIWVFFCFLTILCSKIPVYFLHFWLTKAHVSARGSGSIILASLMLKIGTLGMYKFSPFFLKLSLNKFSPFFFSLSVFSCFVLGVIMNRFFDIKYLVACSSIIHISLIFPSTIVFHVSGILGSILIIVSHGILSCYVFYLVTLLYELSLNRSYDANKRIESFRKFMRFSLFFFFLMNIGFPPFISFMREFFFISLLVRYRY